MSAAEQLEPELQVDAPRPAPAAPVFVRALDLPTASLARARAAVALQLDILSPIPAADVVTDVVLLGPAEGSLSRFAVGFAPASLFAGADVPAVRLEGQLDGEMIAFRFENPARLKAQAERGQARLLTFTALAAGAALILGATSFRLDQDVTDAQARLDAADARVLSASRVKSDRDGASAALTQATAVGNARLLNCALRLAAKAQGGDAFISDLTIDSFATLSFARPLDAAAAAPLVAAGALTTSDTADPTTIRQVQLTAGACR